MNHYLTAHICINCMPYSKSIKIGIAFITKPKFLILSDCKLLNYKNVHIFLLHIVKSLVNTQRLNSKAHQFNYTPPAINLLLLPRTELLSAVNFQPTI